MKHIEFSWTQGELEALLSDVVLKRGCIPVPGEVKRLRRKTKKNELQPGESGADEVASVLFTWPRGGECKVKVSAMDIADLPEEKRRDVEEYLKERMAAEWQEVERRKTTQQDTPAQQEAPTRSPLMPPDQGNEQVDAGLDASMLPPGVSPALLAVSKNNPKNRKPFPGESKERDLK